VAEGEERRGAIAAGAIVVALDVVDYVEMLNLTTGKALQDGGLLLEPGPECGADKGLAAGQNLTFDSGAKGDRTKDPLPGSLVGMTGLEFAGFAHELFAGDHAAGAAGAGAGTGWVPFAFAIEADAESARRGYHGRRTMPHTASAAVVGVAGSGLTWVSASTESIASAGGDMNGLRRGSRPEGSGEVALAYTNQHQQRRAGLSYLPDCGSGYSECSCLCGSHLQPLDTDAVAQD